MDGDSDTDTVKAKKVSLLTEVEKQQCQMSNGIIKCNTEVCGTNILSLMQEIDKPGHGVW